LREAQLNSECPKLITRIVLILSFDRSLLGARRVV
jgi:hypothetical protein